MRLIAFGCSNTFGQGLPDVWDVGKNKGIHNQGPSKYAWPKLLANKLDIECVNTGVLGASNKEIWWNIINYDFQKTDIIIILWTYFNRHYIIHEDKKNISIGAWFENADPTGCHPTTPIAINFFKYLHDEYDMQIDFYLRCNNVQSFLKNNVKLIKHYYPINFGSLVMNIRESVIQEPIWNTVKLSNTILGSQNIADVALDHAHPGLATHKYFAEEIYNEIKNEIT